MACYLRPAPVCAGITPSESWFFLECTSRRNSDDSKSLDSYIGPALCWPRM